jgi:hypothetical protein
MLEGLVIGTTGQVFAVSAPILSTQGRVWSRTTVRLPVGRLLNLTLYNADVSEPFGTVFGRIGIDTDGSNASSGGMCICAGALSNRQPLRIGEASSVHDRTAEVGTSLMTFAAPAAGTDADMLIATADLTRIEGVSFRLTTSAAVADRTITVNFQSGADQIARSLYPTPQTASQTVDYYMSGAGIPPAMPANCAFIPLPVESLGCTCRIQTSTNGIDAGDTYTALKLWARINPV